MEFDLVTNALHSLNEALSYYNNEVDENLNVDKFKFCILLTSHCVELLLKHILVESHPALIAEDIDKYNSANNDDFQTIGYASALKRVKNICHVDFLQYENYIIELGHVRNRIQHYKCNIDGKYYKILMLNSFSAVEYIMNDILKLSLGDYEDVIDGEQIHTLHRDMSAFKARKQDILKEFENGCESYKIMYDRNKSIAPLCPICGSNLLAKEDKIRCKMCNQEYDDFQDLCNSDDSLILSNYFERELGKRKEALLYPIYECPECENNTVVYRPDEEIWMCLSCGKIYGESTYCDDCGNETPTDTKITKTAISDFDTADYKTLCQFCAIKAYRSEDYIGYTIE